MGKLFEITDVSIIGIGKLGASMVAGMASRGFNVVCVDIDQRSVDLINQGKAPVQETGLAEMIYENKKRIRATMSYADAINSSDITFVIVPTPSNSSGGFSTEYAQNAFEEIGRALKNKTKYHVVVLTSTVLPGATRQILLPILERESGKVCGQDFGLCYSPEFIALGTVIRDFLNPDFYLVGQFDDRSGEALESVNSRVALNHAPCARMSIENAELAKIAVNSYVTMKISFANMLSDICEKIPSGNIDVVSNALGMDSRIGRKYLTGGFGFGGPCFPRDNVALSFFGEQLGVDFSLTRANHQFNRDISPRTISKLIEILDKNKTICVLGLAYKPLSHVIEESPGIFLCKELTSLGFKVAAYDPLANNSAREELGNDVLIMDRLEDCLLKGEIFIITTADNEFKKLTAEQILLGRNITVIDFWRCMDSSFEDNSRINYIPIGRCTDSMASKNLAHIWLGN